MANKGHFFDAFANAVSQRCGRPVTFAAALIFIVLWAVSGPFFDFSETWQLVVNTGTTIITFLMVFVLQNSQNRDSRAIQAKLDELILSSQAANEFVGIEKLEEEELRRLSRLLAERAKHIEARVQDLSKKGDA